MCKYVLIVKKIVNWIQFNSYQGIFFNFWLQKLVQLLNLNWFLFCIWILFLDFRISVSKRERIGKVEARTCLKYQAIVSHPMRWRENWKASVLQLVESAALFESACLPVADSKFAMLQPRPRGFGVYTNWYSTTISKMRGRSLIQKYVFNIMDLPHDVSSQYLTEQYVYSIIFLSNGPEILKLVKSKILETSVVSSNPRTFTHKDYINIL